MEKHCVGTMYQKGSGYKQLLLEISLSHPFSLAAVILLSLLGTLFPLIIPLIMRTLIDDVLIGKNGELLFPVLIIFSGIFLVSALANYFSSRVKGSLDLLLYMELSSRIFARIQTADFKELQKVKTGDLQVRTTTNAGTIIQTVTSTIAQILVTLTGIFVPVIIMCSMDARFALIVMSPVFLFVLLSWYFGNRMKNVQRPALDANASLQSFLKEAYSTIPLIKVFRLEKWVQHKYERCLSQYNDTSVNLVKVGSLSSAISLLIYGIPIILVLTMGSLAVLQGTMTIGTLTAFMGYIGLFFSPVQQLSSLWNSYKSSQASYDRINEIIELKSDQAGQKTLFVTKGEINFHDVWFSYDNRIILKKFSASFTRGRNYLIGDNGSGKTTIIKLLCGLHSPDLGEILIDGQNLSQVNRDSLRISVSVVFSDAILIDGTVAENILFGNLSATKECMIQAAKNAELHEFIMKLPAQYETNVGESGLNLSSGEKQKIALARVILRDSPIIIFDEFTRSIDVESKRSIYSVIKKLTDKTIIIITHDMNDIEKDCTVVTMETDTGSSIPYTGNELSAAKTPVLS